MDYKYIEQLLECYWQGQTSVEEEKILCDFFSQKEVPAHLKRYSVLFAFEQSQKSVQLGTDFDQKMLSRIDGPTVHARRNSIKFRLQPFYRAAAVVAVMVCLGLAAQHSFEMKEEGMPNVTYNYKTYEDTFSDPQVALEQVSSALKTVSDGLRKSGLQSPDSVITDKNV